MTKENIINSLSLSHTSQARTDTQVAHEHCSPFSDTRDSVTISYNTLL